MFNLTASNLPIHAKGANNRQDLNNIDMAEFDEDAPDLNDELKSLQGSNSDDNVPNVQYNMLNTNLALGMNFKNVKQFRKALRAWAIERVTSFCFRKNCTTLVWVACKDKGYSFRIRAAKVRDTETFRINSLRPDQSYPKDITKN
ncbi:hypothetical protein M5689_006512 [Euphorbia peplus]|nr:hypothetical protein M5689_006512 [Euphorbia peplus]